jgi:hypothetical protein
LEPQNAINSVSSCGGGTLYFTAGTQPNGIKITGITVKDATNWTFDMEDALNVTIEKVKMLDGFEWVHSAG